MRTLSYLSSTLESYFALQDCFLSVRANSSSTTTLVWLTRLNTSQSQKGFNSATCWTVCESYQLLMRYCPLADWLFWHICPWWGAGEPVREANQRITSLLAIIPLSGPTFYSRPNSSHVFPHPITSISLVFIITIYMPFISPVISIINKDAQIIKIKKSLSYTINTITSTRFTQFYPSYCNLIL